MRRKTRKERNNNNEQASKIELGIQEWLLSLQIPTYLFNKFNKLLKIKTLSQKIMKIFYLKLMIMTKKKKIWPNQNKEYSLRLLNKNLKNKEKRR